MPGPARKELFQKSLESEKRKFEEYFLWVENHLPQSFFDNVDPDTLVFVVHSLMSFERQDFLSHIRFQNQAIALCLDTPDADLKILKNFRNRNIKDYRTFVSNAPPPFPGVQSQLRIAIIHFSSLVGPKREYLPKETRVEVFAELKKRNPDITESEFEKLADQISLRFLKSLTKERLVLAFDVCYRAHLRDPAQIEIRRNDDWKAKKETPSLQIVLGWRHVPKYEFLYRISKLLFRHNLVIKRMSATFTEPDILLMSLGLHGTSGKAAWDETDIPDLLQELALIKAFPGQEIIDQTFVDSKLVRGTLGYFLKTLVSFVHQALVHIDAYQYSLPHIEEGICRHPELTVLLAEAFEAKFHPETHDLAKYKEIKTKFLKLVDQLDTGYEASDLRRKNILKQGLNFIEFTLKTNFYRKNKTALSFRLDPCYLNNVPFDRKEKFPELPFAIFFMKGPFYIGFHIRFRDLARGGLRTIICDRSEQFAVERNNVFSECYNLAFTQQKKNKDIPEGGAKGVILLEPNALIRADEEIYRLELEEAKDPDIKQKLSSFNREHKLEFLYQSQRSYIESFVSIINCEDDGHLRAKNIVDYYKKPEYIYLGPDENMHDSMIVWISNYAKYYHYKPGLSFMSSKPGAGINHKEYGVTSWGINVYMEEVLKFLGIDPFKDVFTIKMSGGPDGDVAGNQMVNLHNFFPKTAKLLCTIDVSGTLFDPQGLDLSVLATLFKEVKPIRFYPVENLSEGGFLLDVKTKREDGPYAQQTKLTRKKNGKIVEEWLSGNEMNHILRLTVLGTKADIFIPGGGRPRTLNEANIKDFLDAKGEPTSRAIIEGANLYISPAARKILEKMGVIIIKDSSSNKGGVICSSFEVLAGLVLSEDEFLKEKPILVKEILEIIKARAHDEATLLLKYQGKVPLTEVSDIASLKINTLTDRIFVQLKSLPWPTDINDPLNRALLIYCPPLLRNKYKERVVKDVPEVHKKAIIACFLAQRLVYQKGLEWDDSEEDHLQHISIISS
jgi:glutamate dehydrogenase